MPNAISGASPRRPIDPQDEPAERRAQPERAARKEAKPSAGTRALLKQFAPKISVTQRPAPPLSDREKIARALRDQGGVVADKPNARKAEARTTVDQPTADCTTEQLAAVATCGAATVASVAGTAVGPADLAVLYFGGMACGAAVLAVDKCETGK